MSDAFPVWPEQWLEDRELAAEEVLADVGGITFASALSTDDRVFLSVTWPGGRRYLMVDPVGNEAPEAFRIGERSDDPDVSRTVEVVWSQALERAKQLMDGELRLGPSPAPEKPRRPWRRGQG